MNLMYNQVKRLDDKEVMKYCKRHEAYVGAKTTETLIDSFLTLSTKALGWVVKIKDIDALQNELKNDYIITKEMSTLSGGLALRCSRYVISVCAVCKKKKSVFYQKSNATYSVECNLSSKYTPWLIQKLNNQLSLPNKSL